MEPDGRRNASQEDKRPAMVTAPQLTTARRANYLNTDHSLKSWLLTQDHKRIAILYLFSTLFFFHYWRLCRGADST